MIYHLKISLQIHKQRKSIQESQSKLSSPHTDTNCLSKSFVTAASRERLERERDSPIVWMMAFCTIFSSLSLEAEFKLTLPIDPPWTSFASNSTLRRRCFNSVLKTSSTVGPGGGHGGEQTHLPNRALKANSHIPPELSGYVLSNWKYSLIYALTSSLRK